MTDAATLKVALGVFNESNAKLCDALEEAGVRCRPFTADVFDAEPLDFARWKYVGAVTNVNAERVVHAVQQGYVPIVSSVGQSAETGQRLNINADIAARELSLTLQVKQKLMFFFSDIKKIKSIFFTFFLFLSLSF